MANETIGTLLHHCGTHADVRKDKRGKLYLMCANCGQLKYNLQGGQDYILENAVMGGADIPLPDHNEEKPIRNVTDSSGKFETVKLKASGEKTVTKKPDVTERQDVTERPNNDGIGAMQL